MINIVYQELCEPLTWQPNRNGGEYFIEGWIEEKGETWGDLSTRRNV